MNTPQRTPMDPKMEAIFEPLKAAMSRKNYSLGDFFELVAGFAETNPEYASAMLRNATDIGTNTEAILNYTPTVIEVYRRTFFHRPTAELYGTAAMLDQGPDLLKQFADYMIASFQMDAAQTASVMGTVPESDQSH